MLESFMAESYASCSFDSEEFSGAKRDECRAKAEGIASYLLKKDGTPTDEDVLQVLQAWCFDQNRLRAHLSKANPNGVLPTRLD